MLEHDADSRNPVSQQDVRALVGIVATLTGDLLGGAVDPDTIGKLAERFVNADLLNMEPDGNHPSAGMVGLALEDLVQRLRYAYGDYDEIPRPLPRVVAHVLGLPSQQAAAACRDSLPTGQMRAAAISHIGGNDWQVVAYYPELQPDADFNERVATLQQIVAEHGGRYHGHEVPAQ